MDDLEVKFGSLSLSVVISFKNEAEASKFYHCSTASKAIIAINVAILVANLALIFTLPQLGLFS